MKSSLTKQFRERLARLPRSVQDQAARAYALWASDPTHPSLSFKPVHARKPFYSVRIGIGYRALGWLENDHVYWFWVGSHAEYDELLRRL